MSSTNCELSVNNASDDLDDGITAMDVGSLTKETLENQARLRDNSVVIAGQE